MSCCFQVNNLAILIHQLYLQVISIWTPESPRAYWLVLGLETTKGQRAKSMYSLLAQSITLITSSKVFTRGGRSLIFWIRIQSSSANHGNIQVWLRKIANSTITFSVAYTCCLTVLLNERQCQFCLMRQKHCYSYFAFNWMRLVEVVTRQVRNTWPSYLTVMSVVAQSDMHGRVFSWFECWQAVTGFMSALCELQAKP